MAKKGHSFARQSTPLPTARAADYGQLLAGISQLLERARQEAARTINRFLTASYWHIGRYLVEYEQGGKARAEYGETLLKRLAQDLSAAHGRGFSERNLRHMRAFYLGWEIRQTPSAKFEAHLKTAAMTVRALSSPTAIPDLMDVAAAFRLSWMPGEAYPVGLILCSGKNDAVVKYATGGINTQVFASQYLTKLPDESLILAELDRTRKLLEHRSGRKSNTGTRGH